MSLLGNLIWIIFGGGIFIFFAYIIGGIFLCFTIIGIPFGVQCIKLSLLGLAPFGREIESSDHSWDIVSLIMNIIWILSGGICLAVIHLVFGLLCAVSIIGIPFAVQHLKLASLSLVPFGKYIKKNWSGFPGLKKNQPLFISSFFLQPCL